MFGTRIARFDDPQRHFFSVGLVRLAGLVAVLAAVLLAGPSDAERLARDAQKAERAGETVKAYLLYAQAAAADRTNPSYWAKAEALRPRAEIQTATKLPNPELTAPAALPLAGSTAGVVGTFTAKDLNDLERMKPPPRLRPSALVQSFQLSGKSRDLFEQVAKVYGYTVIFDKDYDPTATVRFHVADADYRDALHALEDATDSFIVPISDNAMLVAQDNQQKRADLEQDEAQAIPIPQRTSIQEAQELLTMVQQALEIRRAVVDPQRRMILLRDRVSKVEAAVAILDQLSVGKPQVSIELEILSTDKSSSLSLGMSLPSQFPLVDFGRNLGRFGRSLIQNPFVPTGFTQFLTFGGGATFMGIGVTGAQLFATASRSSATSLQRAIIMASDGQPASLHIGSKYPIVTAGYYASGNGTSGGSTGVTYAVISTAPYTDIVSSAVTTTGTMALVVNGTSIPFLVPAATNNVVGLESLINSLQAGVYASVIQRGTNNKPVSLLLVASTLGVTSISLIDDPDNANIQVTKTPDIVSAISADFADATATKISSAGTLSLAVGSTAYPLTLTSTTNNLDGLRDAINAASAGVKASVLLSSNTSNTWFLQVVADASGSGTIQLYDDPTGANTALLTPTDQVNLAGSQLGQTVTSSTGTTSNIGQIYTPPPTFTFEDLGVIVKMTPTVHGDDDVSLDIDAEFKTLGSGSFNGIPVINNRKLQGKIRLRAGEWAIVAGLVDASQASSITGIPGLMHLSGIGPALRDNETSSTESNVLLVIKPRIVSLPASEYPGRTIWLGSETRLLSPL